MGQTAMQKILAGARGEKSQSNRANSSCPKWTWRWPTTSPAPLAIKALEKHGITKLWNKDPHCDRLFRTLCRPKDILSAAQAAVGAGVFARSMISAYFFDERARRD